MTPSSSYRSLACERRSEIETKKMAHEMEMLEGKINELLFENRKLTLDLDSA